VKGDLYRRRVDIIGFVNGLPLLFIECKNLHKNLKTAFEQNFSDYRDTIPHLFHHNAIVMFGNGEQAKIGSITSHWDHFNEWKRLAEAAPGAVDLETLLKGVCEKRNFLDLVENFMLFDETAGEPKKIIARNHQFLGVDRAIEAVRERKARRGKLGVFWHTHPCRVGGCKRAGASFAGSRGQARRKRFPDRGRDRGKRNDRGQGDRCRGRCDRHAEPSPPVRYTSSGPGPLALFPALLISQLVLDESLCAAPGALDRVPRLQIPPTDRAEWYTLILRDVSPFEPAAPDVDIDPNRLVEMQFLCPVDVDACKGIGFDDAGRPSFDVPLSSADESRLAGAEADADRLTAVFGRYRNGCRPTWLEFGFAHMTGTTRMSATDDGSGVTDYNGRVWGFENLFLATNGLIPTRMAVNPTLTGVALAARITDGIVNR
jgi:hypothetical protein